MRLAKRWAAKGAAAAGLVCLAMAAAPAVASAQVTAEWDTTLDRDKFITTVTSITTTEPFNYCEVYVYDIARNSYDPTSADPAKNTPSATSLSQRIEETSPPIPGQGTVLTNAPGATAVSRPLPNGTFWVILKCKEGANTAYQHIGLPKKFTITNSSVMRCGGKRATIVSTYSREEINGTPGDDVIVAYDGRHTINGGGGNDRICVFGGGDDIINGGEGNDYIASGEANDTIDGGPGRDIIRGGAGNDTIGGGDGNDMVFGGAGDDTLDGGAGRDIAKGDAGTDSCVAELRSRTCES